MIYVQFKSIPELASSLEMRPILKFQDLLIEFMKITDANQQRYSLILNVNNFEIVNIFNILLDRIMVEEKMKWNRTFCRRQTCHQ